MTFARASISSSSPEVCHDQSARVRFARRRPPFLDANTRFVPSAAALIAAAMSAARFG
jgi:hypothetical protein